MLCFVKLSISDGNEPSIAQERNPIYDIAKKNATNPGSHNEFFARDTGYICLQTISWTAELRENAKIYEPTIKIIQRYKLLWIFI